MKIACAALGLTLGLTCGLATAADGGLATGSSCTAFSKVAVERIAANSDELTGFSNEESIDWRVLQAVQPPAHAATLDAELRMVTVDGFTPNPRVYETIAWRLDGHWQIYARSRPEKPRPSRHRPLWSRWVIKRPIAAITQEIDGAIGGPCLWTSPRAVPNDLPLLDGGHVSFYDGPSTLLDVRVGPRHWQGAATSWRLGPAGQIRNALMSIAFRHAECMDGRTLVAGGRAPPCPPRA